MFEKMFCRKSKKASEFSDFGIFANIHRYFRDRYRTDADHTDFYIRAGYFFRAMMVVLAGEAFHEDAPEGSEEYHRLIHELGEHTIESHLVVDYLLCMAQKANVADKIDPIEVSFYQNFLVGQALPVLFSQDLRDEEFDTIVNQIPGEILLSAQEESCVGKDTLRSSIMFVQLCESYAPTTMYRYCKLVSLFPISDQRTERYLSSVELLRIMDSQQTARVKITHEVQEDQSIQSAIFQVLLLSVRLKDQKAAKEAFKTKSVDTHFMVNTLCEEAFLARLVTKGIYGSPLGHPACVYELFVFCMSHGSDAQNNLIVKQLNWAVSDYAEKNNQAPLVRVSSLFGINGAKFFGMLDSKFAKNIYTKKLFNRFIKKLKEDANLSDKKQIQLIVISFISLCLHIDPQNQPEYDHLLHQCTELFGVADTLRSQVVELIEAYLTSQTTLYPDASAHRVFVKCMQQLRVKEN